MRAYANNYGKRERHLFAMPLQRLYAEIESISPNNSPSRVKGLAGAD